MQWEDGRYLSDDVVEFRFSVQFSPPLCALFGDRPGEGLATCTWTFESFGTAKKGAATRVGDREAIAVHVTDKADKEGTYTFYVATEGKPYLLRTVYKGGGNVTTTSCSAFDEPLDVRPPASAQVVDKADVGG